MTQDEDRPPMYGLTLPVPGPVPAGSRYAYWLKLADIALKRAREEQARIKAQIKPHVERYKQIKGKRPRNAA